MANQVAVHEKGFTVLYEAPHSAIEYVHTFRLLSRAHAVVPCIQLCPASSISAQR